MRKCLLSIIYTNLFIQSIRMYLAKAKDYTHIVRHSSSSQQINSLDTYQEGAHKTRRHDTRRHSSLYTPPSYTRQEEQQHLSRVWISRVELIVGHTARYKSETEWWREPQCLWKFYRGNNENASAPQTERNGKWFLVCHSDRSQGYINQNENANDQQRQLNSKSRQY